MSELRTKRSFLAVILLFGLAALAGILFVHRPVLVASAWGAGAAGPGGAVSTADGSGDGASPQAARASGHSLQPYRMLPWLLTLMPQHRAEAAQVPARGTALRGGAPAAAISTFGATPALQPQTAPFTQSNAAQYMPNPALLARSYAKFWSGMADAVDDARGSPLTPAQRLEIQSTMRSVDRRKPETLD